VNATSTDERIDRALREHRERVRRAIERGGLPTQAEIYAAEEAIGKAYNAVEDLAVRVAGIADIENSIDAADYAVTLEQIGLVAAFAVDLLDLEIPQLRERAEQLRAAVGPLNSVRLNSIRHVEGRGDDA
jgi:hypothetical protein